MNSKITTALLLAFLLGGCSTYMTPEGSHPYKAAVNQMVEKQTANPDKIVTDAMPIVDGTITANVIETYRKETGKPQEIKNEIQVNIGK